MIRNNTKEYEMKLNNTKIRNNMKYYELIRNKRMNKKQYEVI